MLTDLYYANQMAVNKKYFGLRTSDSENKNHAAVVCCRKSRQQSWLIGYNEETAIARYRKNLLTVNLDLKKNRKTDCRKIKLQNEKTANAAWQGNVPSTTFTF